MKTKRIAIIVNSFNRRDLLERCLNALARWLPTPDGAIKATIFIYDAGSKDGSLEWIRESCTLPLDIHLIDGSNDPDNSFSAGLNKASNTAIEQNPDLDYLLFYETDNEIPHREAIEQAILCLEQVEHLAACGFTVRRHDGSNAGAGMPFPRLSSFALGKKITHRFKLEQVPYAWSNRDGVSFSYADVVFTSPLIVRAAAWIDSSGLDADTFPFSDCDIDWAKRLREKGWRMGLIERDDVIHDNSDSLSNWSKQRALHYHRARLKYFKRHHPKSIFLVWPHFLALRHLAEVLIVSLFVRDPNRRNHLKPIAGKLLKGVFKSYD